MFESVVRDVTAEEIEAFARDGALCLRRILNPEWVTQVADEVDKYMLRSKHGLTRGET